MPKEMIVNATLPEVRVAYVEDGEITDLAIEREAERGVVGNIYKGKVLRVLPGMQACFVDIGLEKAAFLYVDDVFTENLKMGEVEVVEDDEADEEEEEAERAQEEALKTIGEKSEKTKEEIEYEQKRKAQKRKSSKDKSEEEDEPIVKAKVAKGRKIEDLVKEGEELLVQVAKGPISSKGARLTCHISLPSRNLVFMPTVRHIGVSRKIGSYEERKRLRKKIDEMVPEGGGFIVRTACEGISDEKLESDINYLISVWEEIKREFPKTKAGTLVHAELNLVLKQIRDLLAEDVNRVVIDNQKLCQEAMSFVSRHMPAFKDKIYPYDGKDPIFEAYGIDLEIKRALDKQVWLPSGGYLVVEQTEALCVIDVNTGKFVGEKDLEATITKTNIEAVAEIAYQLKLRNIGGIIIIDLIDMERYENKRKVFRALEEVIRRDRSKVSILKISEFGLIEMTRKRTRDTLVRTMCEPCFYCEGRGYIKNKHTVGYDLLRLLHKDASSCGEKELHIYAHPAVIENVRDNEMPVVNMISETFNKKIHLRSDPNYHFEQFEIFAG